MRGSTATSATLPLDQIPRIYEFRVAASDQGRLGRGATLNVTLSSSGENPKNGEIEGKMITRFRRRKIENP